MLKRLTRLPDLVLEGSYIESKCMINIYKCQALGRQWWFKLSYAAPDGIRPRVLSKGKMSWMPFCGFVSLFFNLQEVSFNLGKTYGFLFFINSLIVASFNVTTRNDSSTQVRRLFHHWSSILIDRIAFSFHILRSNGSTKQQCRQGKGEAVNATSSN